MIAQPCPLPAGALLSRYADPTRAAHTDAFVAEAPGSISLEALILAFYSGRILTLELLAIHLLFGKPGSKACAERLSSGQADTFSAWRVEDRDSNQLLMRESIGGATRSWLMVDPQLTGSAPATRLYFGSAVLPARGPQNPPRMGPLFQPLLPFHKVYSRLLLDGAVARLEEAATRSDG